VTTTTITTITTTVLLLLVRLRLPLLLYYYGRSQRYVGVLWHGAKISPQITAIILRIPPGNISSTPIIFEI
jgi:hypothetical protein